MYLYNNYNFNTKKYQYPIKRIPVLKTPKTTKTTNYWSN